MNIDEAIAKIMAAMETYGPQATELALETARIGAIQNVACGVFVLGLGLFLLWTARWCGRKGLDASFYDKEQWFIGALLSAAMGALFVLMSVFATLSNVYAIIGMFRPEVYLAAKVLGL